MVVCPKSQAVPKVVNGRIEYCSGYVDNIFGPSKQDRLNIPRLKNLRSYPHAIFQFKDEYLDEKEDDLYYFVFLSPKGKTTCEYAGVDKGNDYGTRFTRFAESIRRRKFTLLGDFNFSGFSLPPW